MPQNPRRAATLFSTIDTAAFVSILTVTLVLTLLILANVASDRQAHHGIAVDLPKASHPASMPGALREQTIQVTITSHGWVFFGNDRVSNRSLADKIRERIKIEGVEKKVYIRVDARARWSDVEEVLDCVRSAGLLRVAFLVDEPRTLSAASL